MRTRRNISAASGGSPLAGVSAGDALVLVTTKFGEARAVLGPLVEAAGTMPGVHIAIKTHPAETPDVYAAVAAGRDRVRVLDAAAPLAPLLRGSAALVTVNSTVALDAAVLGVPALVIGLPNNLSPFVDAGVMAGVAGADADRIAQALGRILYDEEFRQRLEDARGAFLARYKIGADGHAAERSAEVIRRLADR
jgi:UDP-N-acetylglucosamine 2-epimerase